MSQNERILKHLQSGKRLTPLDALVRFQSFRLSARIHNLKAQGYDVRSEMVKRKGKLVAQYRLEPAA